MRTRILIVLLMASCSVWPGCERNGPVEPPTGRETGPSEDSDTPDSSPEAKTRTPTEALNVPDVQVRAEGERASTSSDPLDETADPSAGDSETGASDGGNNSTDSALGTDQPKLVMYDYAYPSGAPRMTMPAYQDKDGRLIKHGLVSEVSETGVVRIETHWAHGKKDGVYRSWYETGVLSQQGEFAMGTQIGTWTWWYSNGKMERQGTYNEKNERHGKWTYWDRQGVLLREETWVNGAKQLGD